MRIDLELNGLGFSSYTIEYDAKVKHDDMIAMNNA